MEIKEMNIYEKMAMITTEIGIVAKNLQVQVNQKSSYKAVSERDILDAVKPIESKFRVYSYPFEREIVDEQLMESETQYGKRTSLYMRLKTVYRFINIDKADEYIDITSYADGIDTGDKATGKAMTYADKYALMKAYKISTGDDPDKEASPENGYKQTSVKLASTAQIGLLEKYYKGEAMQRLLKANNIDEIDELPMAKASELIQKIKAMNG